MGMEKRSVGGGGEREAAGERGMGRGGERANGKVGERGKEEAEEVTGQALTGVEKEGGSEREKGTRRADLRVRRYINYLYFGKEMYKDGCFWFSPYNVPTPRNTVSVRVVMVVVGGKVETGCI